MFGFDIEILDKLRRQIIKNKHPYDMVSNSQQNKRLSILGKDMDSTITQLFHEHNFVSSEILHYWVFHSPRKENNLG